ncbi:MAG: HAD-IIIA family hydrolase [Bacteroidales bacterium]|nr:HAD-IIIA family hydrolase [Bacteroidales bacterium]
MASKAQVLFLDRDGVINRLLPGDYVKKWDEFHFIPGIKEALAIWNKRFKSIVLVTNQRGVGKGLMSDADLSRIHARMMTEIMDAGGRIDLILTCTALSDEDPRRKPNVGMFLEACQLLPGLKPEDCIMIGDTPSDAAFAVNCGMQFILL